MADFEVSVLIEAPPRRVWDELADIGGIHRWNPGVERSYATSDTTGLGASRRCDLVGGHRLDETVVAWEPERRLTMRITDTDLPFERGDIHFRLQPEAEATRVFLRPDYALKYGPLGRLLDAVYAAPRYRRGMRALLAGLKRRVEAGAGARGEVSRPLP